MLDGELAPHDGPELHNLPDAELAQLLRSDVVLGTGLTSRSNWSPERGAEEMHMYAGESFSPEGTRARRYCPGVVYASTSAGAPERSTVMRKMDSSSVAGPMAATGALVQRWMAPFRAAPPCCVWTAAPCVWTARTVLKYPSAATSAAQPKCSI